MNEDKKQLQQERIQINRDLNRNVLPKRLPINISLSHPIASSYAKERYADVQYDFKRIANATRELCEKVYSDACPMPGGSSTVRLASYFSILGAKSFRMGDSGFMQHPNVTGLEVSDYPYFIKDPYACILERVIPRLYDNLNPAENPVASMMSLEMANASRMEDRADLASFLGELNEQYGYYPGPPKGSMGQTEAPYDFLADLLRGFSGISADIHRDRGFVKEAVEALYPLVFKLGLPPKPDPEGCVPTPWHMVPFMRPKDFEELWFPTYKRLCEDYAALGVRISAFCEGDSMHVLDCLQDLPAGIQLRFEYGDAKIIKEKLGDKFILSGLYPISLIDTGSAQQVTDKAKELLDIMMPGGGYTFSFDKGTNVHNTINLDNLNLLAEYLRDHAVYENAGQPFGKALNSEGFTCDKAALLKTGSRYDFDWESFHANNPNTPEFAKVRFEKYYDQMFSQFMGLLM